MIQIKKVNIIRFTMIVNRVLRPLGFKIIHSEKEGQKPWDKFFIDCVKEYRRSGKDPNDVLNENWKNEKIFYSTYLKPLLKAGMVALEVGPGIGRYTRHVLPYCREIYLIDYSRYCCEFLREYFKGKGGIHIIHISGEKKLLVPDNSVDLVFSISTFVHLYFEAIYWYFEEFYRILRKGGKALINYTSMMNPYGYQFFQSYLPKNAFKERSIFRFYHPEMIEKIAIEIGFHVEMNITHENQRGYSFLLLSKR